MFVRSLLPVFIIIFLVACENNSGDCDGHTYSFPADTVPATMPPGVFVQLEDELKVVPRARYDSLQEVYIAKYTHVAQAMMREYGVPASVLLAQGLHETQAGTSKLARQNHNHFGIQCYSGGCNEGHCSNPLGGHMHKVHFRVYHNPWQGWEAHAQRLSRDPRYKKCLPQPGIRFNAYAWTRALQQNGFSADPKYGEKIYNLVQKYNLEELDEGWVSKPEKSTQSNTRIFPVAVHCGGKFRYAKKETLVSFFGNESEILLTSFGKISYSHFKY